MNLIVTGASRGIGYEIVKQFSADSKNHIVAIARNKPNLEKLKRECLSINSSANIFPLVFDLSAGDLKNDLLPAILRYINPIDILINNAATLINKPFEEITEKELFSIYNTNVFSIFKLIQALVPYMNRKQASSNENEENSFEQSNAHIVNITSIGGFQGSKKFPGLAAYSSSKGALSTLTECLAEELEAENIKVNALALGSVQTDMLSEAFPGYKALVTPAQMATFVVDFAIHGSKLFNGKIIPVSSATP